jgi:hypothetical protein
MDSAGYGLGFNYGSALGIANVHYNNVPVPAQTAAYIAARLDPAVDPSFAPPAENDLERQALMQERLPAYAHVGVKYVLASPTFHAIPAYSITQARTTVPLLPGSAIETTARNETADVISVAGLTFQVYNRGRNADGHLQASVCVGDDCVQGFADLDIARDERPFLIPLGNVLRVAPGATYTVRLARQGGTGAFALYLYRPETTAAVTATADHGSLPAGFALPLGFIPRMDLLPVHLGTSMAIYELPNPRSYFSAPGCDVTAHDRAHVEVSCAAPATLTRLELMMRGWRASVNGLPAEIGREDETFQTVAVPAGHAVVAFTYAPTGIRTAFVVAAVTLLMVLLVLANATRGGRHAVK